MNDVCKIIFLENIHFKNKLDRVKRIWYLSPIRAAKVQASLLIRAVSPEPPLLAHTTSESRGTFRQKARSLAPLNGWACTVKICNDGMLEDTNSLDGDQLFRETGQSLLSTLQTSVPHLILICPASPTNCLSVRDQDKNNY